MAIEIKEFIGYDLNKEAKNSMACGTKKTSTKKTKTTSTKKK